MSDPQESVPTKQRIMQDVDQLFYHQGIRAVGVDTIVRELGISKKTLYRHFRSKGEMIEAYLEGRSRPILISEKPPAQQILDYFQWIERSVSDNKEFRGCAFLNAIVELGE